MLNMYKERELTLPLLFFVVFSAIDNRVKIKNVTVSEAWQTSAEWKRYKSHFRYLGDTYTQTYTT